ncbi:D-arabinono-1,4-lactone oxidase [Rummeliibacillus pycnus]|uniref:D-arabinono-1,4-lactone oxidase n=1 Tax=Rummeliibacillus pycnus TaxID=101070 RepID=UPI0037C76A9A
MFSVKDWVDTRKWQNWAGNVKGTPTQSLLPHDTKQLSNLIWNTQKQHKTIRVTGAAHSFSPIAKPDDIAISLHNMRGLIDINRDTGEATFWAGTYLYEIGPILAQFGFALANMGDIHEQTIAGAIGTGTHGTGVTLGSLSSQVVMWGFVDGLGNYHEHTRGDDDISKALHISLGLLGVLVKVTIKTVPLYSLKCQTTHYNFDEANKVWDMMIREHRHVEWFYFPGTERIQVKIMDQIPIVEQSKKSKTVEDLKNNVIENGLLLVVSEVCKIQPKATKWVSNLASKSLPNSVKQGLSYEIFPSSRKVKFLEMEYAIPLEHFNDCMEEIHFTLKSHPFKVHFPIECRTTKGESGFLSPTQDRESAFIAFHMYRGMDEKDYFRWVQKLMRKYNGRPHWGKMNHLTKEHILELYPNYPRFLQLREKYDPENIFVTDYFKKLIE